MIPYLPRQTESGWPIVANPLGLKSFEPKVGSASVAMPGYDIRILSDEGEELPRGELGECIRLSICLSTI